MFEAEVAGLAALRATDAVLSLPVLPVTWPLLCRLVPVTDNLIANGAEPWLIPDVASLPDISPSFRTDPADFQLNKEVLDRGLTNSVRDNDDNFPPEWRLSRRGRATDEHQRRRNFSSASDHSF